MKQKLLNNYLKLGILFFGIVFLFYRCEKEHFEYQESNNGFIVKTIYSEDITRNRLLSETLDKIQKAKPKNVSFRTVYNSQYDFYIDTDEAVYIENGEYHSYTLLVYRGFQTELTENLLLSLQSDLTYKAFIVSYDFTGEEKQMVENGQYVSLTDKVAFTPLENFDTDEITNELSRVYYNAAMDYCYELVEETSRGTGWTILVKKQIPCETENIADDPISGSGSGSSGSGSEDPTDGEDPYNGSLGGGSPNGDNTYNPDSDNNDDTNSDENTEQLDDCLQTDENGNCIGNATMPLVKTKDDDCDTSKEDLKEVFPDTSDDRLQEIVDAINEHGKDFGIDTKEKLQHFISQAGHESANFTGFTENLNYRIKKLGINYWKSKFNPYTAYIDSLNVAVDSTKQNPNDYSSTTSTVYVDNEKFANFVYDDANRGAGYKLGNTSEGDGYKYRGRGIFQLTGKTNYSNFNTYYQENIDEDTDLVENPDLIASDKEIAVISALWYYENNVLDKITIDSATTVKKVTKKVNGGSNGLEDRKEIFEDCEEHIDCNTTEED